MNVCADAPSLTTWSGSRTRMAGERDAPVGAQDVATAEQAPSSSPAMPSQAESTEQDHASAGAEGQPVAAGHSAEGDGMAYMETHLDAAAVTTDKPEEMACTSPTAAAVTTDAQGAAGWVSNPMFDEPSEATQLSAGQSALAGTRGGVTETGADEKFEEVLENLENLENTDAGGQIVAVPAGRPPSGRERRSEVVDGMDGAQKRAFDRGGCLIGYCCREGCLLDTVL